MIPRYSLPEMADLFTDEARYGAWLEVEILATEAWSELGVVPKSDAAIEAGSVGPWEAGGISPYQYDAGQRKAKAEGRDYDSFGATPVSAPSE